MDTGKAKADDEEESSSEEDSSEEEAKPSKIKKQKAKGDPNLYMTCFDTHVYM